MIKGLFAFQVEEKRDKQSYQSIAILETGTTIKGIYIAKCTLKEIV